MTQVPSEIKESFNLTNQDLLSFQYYNNEAIIFKTSGKVEAVTQNNLSNSQISRTETTYRTEINLQAFTPGVAVKIENSMYIDFGDGIIVPFEPRNGKWFYKIDRYSYGHKIATETIVINGKEYYVYFGGTPNFGQYYDEVFLYADLTILQNKKEEIQKQTAPGRIIKNR